MDAEAIKAKAKAEAKRKAEDQKYSLFLQECKATDLSDIEKLNLVCGDAGADLLGRRIVTIALGLKTLASSDFCKQIILICSKVIFCLFVARRRIWWTTTQEGVYPQTAVNVHNQANGCCRTGTLRDGLLSHRRKSPPVRRVVFFIS